MNRHGKFFFHISADIQTNENAQSTSLISKTNVTKSNISCGNDDRDANKSSNFNKGTFFLEL